jgi:hypothetical protein
MLRGLGVCILTQTELTQMPDYSADRIVELEAEVAKLRSQEQELRDCIDNAAMPMHWVGPDGTILWANCAELDLLGYSREEYIGPEDHGFPRGSTSD